MRRPTKLHRTVHLGREWLAVVPSATKLRDLRSFDFWRLVAKKLRVWDWITVRADDDSWQVAILVYANVMKLRRRGPNAPVEMLGMVVWEKPHLPRRPPIMVRLERDPGSARRSGGRDLRA